MKNWSSIFFAIWPALAVIAIGFTLPAMLDERNWSLYNKWLAASNLVNGFLVLAGGVFVISAVVLQNRAAFVVAMQQRAEREELQKSIAAQTAIDVAQLCQALAISTRHVASHCRALSAELLAGRPIAADNSTFLNLKNVDLVIWKEILESLDEGIVRGKQALHSVENSFHGLITVDMALAKAHCVNIRKAIIFLGMELPRRVLDPDRIAGLEESASGLEDVCTKFQAIFFAAGDSMHMSVRQAYEQADLLRSNERKEVEQKSPSE